MTFAPEPIHPDTWPAIHAVLAPAMAWGGYSAAEIIDDLLSGSAQLWVKREGGDPIAAAVSQLVADDEGRFVHGKLLSGRGVTKCVDEAVDCVTEHARKVGAAGIRITGRCGWDRVLGAKGWKRRAVTMQLDFKPEHV